MTLRLAVLPVNALRAPGSVGSLEVDNKVDVQPGFGEHLARQLLKWYESESMPEAW
jgi:hypothetical protein